MSSKRTSKEWYTYIEDKIEIRNRDGWSQTNDDYFNNVPITEKEFKSRLYTSSCIFKDIKFIVEYLS